MAEFQEYVPLAGFSNYRLGGPARYFFEAHTLEETVAATRRAKAMGVRVFILGGGTNLLINDAGFDGLVLKPNIRFLEADGAMVRVGAGVNIAELLNFTVHRGLSGLEWAGGLPGTVGGAVRGNAGAFGGEIKNSLAAAESIRVSDGKFKKRNNSECRFAYRHSVFKEERGAELIINSVFSLSSGRLEEIQAAIEAKIKFRRERHPMEYPNIGSIFKNVPVEKFIQSGAYGNVAEVRAALPVKNDPFPIVPTAYLISEVNLKGTQSGQAIISPKHPNFIVNLGKARATEVEELIKIIKTAVFEKFRVLLEEEVQRV